MTLPNPEHLFEQALKLSAAPPAGAPRQTDLRRAISAAYYAVFHTASTAAADEFVGITNRTSPEYALVYRSIEHRNLRELSEEVLKAQPRAKYAKFLPKAGFDAQIKSFATAVIELQEKRHTADYDPQLRVRRSDALLAIGTARAAVDALGRAGNGERKAYLTLLLFPPR